MRMLTSPRLVNVLLKHLRRTPLQTNYPNLFSGVTLRPLEHLQNHQVRYKNIGTNFKASPSVIAKLILKDNVPENYTLIYRAPSEFMLLLAYPATLFICAANVVYYVYKYFTEGEIQIRVDDDPSSFMFVNPKLELRIYTAAVFLFACGILSLLFKYPYRIYKHSHKKEYIAIFSSRIPLKRNDGYQPYTSSNTERRPTASYPPATCFEET